MKIRCMVFPSSEFRSSILCVNYRIDFLCCVLWSLCHLIILYIYFSRIRWSKVTWIYFQLNNCVQLEGCWEGEEHWCVLHSLIFDILSIAISNNIFCVCGEVHVSRLHFHLFFSRFPLILYHLAVINNCTIDARIRFFSQLN